MSDIFLCYSRTDSHLAGQLEQRLKAEGWSVYRDVQTRIGKRYHQAIEKELHAARAVVVLWSQTSRDSDFVLEEAEYGKRNGILSPAFIERVEYPYGFSRIQTADLIGWAGENGHHGLTQLLDSLQEHLQGTESQDPKITVPLSTRVARPKTAPWAPGQTFRDNLQAGGEGPLMVVIPGGRFMMGSPTDEPERLDNEGPRHEVIIASAFAMGVYPVTFDDYGRFCATTRRDLPYDQGWGRGNRPVINVSWTDARDYCGWLGEQTGQRYRLPSEAEWEYACRAGKDSPFFFGDRLTTDQANFDGNYTYNSSTKGEYRAKTIPVGSFPPNTFGLYDMHGNVWEWCQDTWHGNYKEAPGNGSAWESGGEVSRVLRGGSWYYGPRGCRAAGRGGSVPGYRYSFIGFRVCRVVPIE